MKNVFIVVLLIAVIVLGAYAFNKTGSQPQQQLSPQVKQNDVRGLISFVDRAAQAVSNKGDAAFSEFNDPQGGWISGDQYVFVYDMNGDTLVLPPQADLVGTNRMETADPQGEKFVTTMVNILKFKDYGWNTYLYVKPGETSPSSKLSYFKKVVNGGKAYIVGSGIYLAN